jgi:hypothetical protein
LLVVLAIGGLTLSGFAQADSGAADVQEAYAAALAVDPTLDAPPADGSPFAVGGFQGLTTPGVDHINVGFSAHFDSSGAPFGHVSQTETNEGVPNLQVRYDVVCLSINGSDAAMGLVVTQAASNDPGPGAQRVLAVRDTGAPGGAGDEYAFYNTAANTCPAFTHGASLTITNGNIAVHD